MNVGQSSKPTWPRGQGTRERERFNRMIEDQRSLTELTDEFLDEIYNQGSVAVRKPGRD